MSFNADKSAHVMFTKMKSQVVSQFDIASKPIPTAKQLKYVSVILDGTLTLVQHLDYVVTTMRNRIGSSV